MKTKIKEGQVILHGECMVFLSTIPADAVKLNSNGPFQIVAPSETTGNHHVVDLKEGVQFYQGTNGTLYMTTDVDTAIRCVVDSRHDAIVLPAGQTYEFGSQMEYDPFTARQNKVRD